MLKLSSLSFDNCLWRLWFLVDDVEICDFWWEILLDLDDEILGIFMEICDEILMVFTMYFLAPWFSVQGFELGFLDTSMQTILFMSCLCFMSYCILYIRFHY